MRVYVWKLMALMLNLQTSQVVGTCYFMSRPLFECFTLVDSQTMIPAPLTPPEEGNKPAQTGQSVLLSDRRRIFKQIIVKCVLQLLLIETTHELLQNTEVYTTIPPEHLLRLMGELDHSYQFARSFNEDKELRTGLWKVGKCHQ